MVAPSLQELATMSRRLVPLTTGQYHEMIRRGIIPEGAPIELLDGMLVRKDRSKAGTNPKSIGDKHAWSVEQLRDLKPQLAALGYSVRAQQPIWLSSIQEPEPDASIVRGDNSTYLKRKPGPADVVCVIEVADSSIEHDRTTKLRIYAQAGIMQYAIVNLVSKQIEDYRLPDPARGTYDPPRLISRDGLSSIQLDADRCLEVAAKDLIPA